MKDVTYLYYRIPVSVHSYTPPTVISLYSTISWDAEERGVSEEGGEERGVSEEGGKVVFRPFVLENESEKDTPNKKQDTDKNKKTHDYFIDSTATVCILPYNLNIHRFLRRRRCVVFQNFGIILSSSSFLFLSLTRDATRLISATILGTRTEDACWFRCDFYRRIFSGFRT